MCTHLTNAPALRKLFREGILPRLVVGDDCWDWLGSKTTAGYGHVGLGRRGSRAYLHRLMFELFNGPIPAGHGVLHTCDNPSCSRPSHLFTGTQAANMRDASEKGRIAGRGQRVLDDVAVREIRRLAGQESYSSLARRFGVSKGAVAHVVSRRNYAWVA